MRDDVEAHHRDEAENEVRERLMDHVIEANPFEVPESMVEDYMDRMLDAPDDVDPEELARAERAIEQLYQTRGYPFAQATAREVRTDRLDRELIERATEKSYFDVTDHEVLQIIEPNPALSGEPRRISDILQ